jgi:hypothetical protein
VATGQAVVWPAALGPVSNRLGYTTSAGAYLPGEVATGMTISIVSGSAIVYAGTPNAASHRVLAGINAGQSYVVTGLAAGEVISVQGGNSFAYTWSLPATPPTPTPPTPTPPTDPTATPVACVDPATCNPVSSILAYWRCNIPGCTYPDWVASAINWPSWAAYSFNARAGDQSRTVYSAEGQLLYPYMGPWAHGCKVTAVTGRTLIIEWQRGTDVWRETYLMPGQSHTITLIPPENGALIETQVGDPIISVILENCNPQPLP